MVQALITPTPALPVKGEGDEWCPPPVARQARDLRQGDREMSGRLTVQGEGTKGGPFALPLPWREGIKGRGK